MPVQYKAGIIKEHNHVRQVAGLFDVSHMGQIFVHGKETVEFLSYVTTWDMSRLSDGDCRYCHILNEDGQIIDDTIVYTFSSDNFMLVPNASTVTKIFDWFNLKSADFDVVIDNRSNEYFCFAVQGP